MTPAWMNDNTLATSDGRDGSGTPTNPLVTRKVCLVGSFFVGKTSTATRFHSNTFGEKYLATVGVSVNTRDLLLDGERKVRLVVWDLASMADLSPLHLNYLTNAAGIVLVADATRKPTLDHALGLKREIDRKVAALPTVLLLNKIDLAQEREIHRDQIVAVAGEVQGWFETSAKTGVGVTEAFTHLARLMR